VNLASRAVPHWKLTLVRGASNSRARTPGTPALTSNLPTEAPSASCSGPAARQKIARVVDKVLCCRAAALLLCFLWSTAGAPPLASPEAAGFDSPVGWAWRGTASKRSTIPMLPQGSRASPEAPPP
jgi:hypothetical protein